MAVPLPQSTGTVVPEYAANSINFTRQVVNVNGELTAIFSANIPYERRDYFVNGGKRVGLVSGDPTLGPANSDRYGTVFVSPEQLGALFVQVAPTNKAIGEVIADMADELIHADLVARGIITV